MFTRKNDSAMTAYNPFRLMDELERSFSCVPNSFLGGAPVEFRTDVKDEGDAFLLEADLPGFDKENIHLDVEGDVLTITAERHSEHEDSDKRGKYICCERSYGSYSRAFDVSGIVSDGIKARFDNGVLTLTMPKKSPALPTSKRLEIE